MCKYWIQILSGYSPCIRGIKSVYRIISLDCLSFNAIPLIINELPTAHNKKAPNHYFNKWGVYQYICAPLHQENLTGCHSMSNDRGMDFDNASQFIHLVVALCPVGLHSPCIHDIIISSVMYRSSFILWKYASQGPIMSDVLLSRIARQWNKLFVGEV